MKKQVRSLLIMVTAVALLFCINARAARADQEVEQIFEKIGNLNEGLKDYQADINIALRAKVAFIPYNPDMSGKYYHKAPDKHKLVLEKAPSYVKKYPNIFGWHLPKIEKFNSRVKDVTELNGREVWHILLLPKQGMGDIISEEMWVDCENYTVPRQITNYKNDGMICVNVNYAKKDGYWVFDTMTAQFSFPKVAVNATASARYSNYRFNQNLPDSFFAQEEKK